jgi:hypothetical protein
MVPVGENPVECGGICVAVAVCADYCLFHNGNLAGRINATPLPRKVLCIPACMSDSTLTFTVPAVAPWPGNYAVLANSHPCGCGSFIKNTGGEKRPSFGERGSNRRNRLILRTWDQLDSANGT